MDAMSDTTREAVERVMDGLRNTAEVRIRASAHEYAPEMLHVVARLSLEDAAMMQGAADTLTALLARAEAAEAERDCYAGLRDGAEAALAAERETVARLTEALQLAILWCSNENLPKSAIAKELDDALSAARAALTQKDRTDV